VLADEQLLVVDDRPGLELEAPQPLAAEGGDEQVALPLRDGAVVEDHRTRPGRLGWLGDEGRIDVAVVAGCTGHLGPAVVAARLDPVDLVVDVGAELGGPQLTVGVPRQPLHVAVAEGVDRRARLGVVVGDLAVGGDPQDLPGERRGVGRERGLAGVAGGDVEQPVGAERDPAAVVDAGLRDAGHHRLGIRVVVQPEPHHPVVLPGGEVGVDPRPVVGVDGQTEQSAFPGRVDVEGAERRRAAVLVDLEEAAGVPLGDEDAAVGGEDEVPGGVETGDDVADRDLDRRRVVDTVSVPQGRVVLDVTARSVGRVRGAVGVVGGRLGLLVGRLGRRLVRGAAGRAQHEQGDGGQDERRTHRAGSSPAGRSAKVTAPAVRAVSRAGPPRRRARAGSTGRAR
jgi:hypothetical protein